MCIILDFRAYLVAAFTVSSNLELVAVETIDDSLEASSVVPEGLIPCLGPEAWRPFGALHDSGTETCAAVNLQALD